MLRYIRCREWYDAVPLYSGKEILRNPVIIIDCLITECSTKPGDKEKSIQETEEGRRVLRYGLNPITSPNKLSYKSAFGVLLILVCGFFATASFVGDSPWIVHDVVTWIILSWVRSTPLLVEGQLCLELPGGLHLPYNHPNPPTRCSSQMGFDLY